MKTQVLVATLIGAVVAFLAGWVLWGMLTMDYYESNMNELFVNEISRPEPILWMIFVAQIFWSLMLAYLFDQMNIRDFKEGAKCGAMICILMFLGMNLMLQAQSEMFTNYTIIAVDVLLNAVFGAVVGGVIGWWLGRGQAAA